MPARKVAIFEQLKESAQDVRSFEKGKAVDLRVARIPRVPEHMTPMRREMPHLSKDLPFLPAGECFAEIARCNSEIAKVQKEYGQWIAANPNGSRPGPSLLIADWQRRKAKADARFQQLTKLASL